MKLTKSNARRLANIALILNAVAVGGALLFWGELVLVKVTDGPGSYEVIGGDPDHSPHDIDRMIYEDAILDRSVNVLKDTEIIQGK